MDRTFLFKDQAGEWRWKVIAPNNQIIASSGEGFTRLADARRAMRRAGHGPAELLLSPQRKDPS